MADQHKKRLVEGRQIDRVPTIDEMCATTQALENGDLVLWPMTGEVVTKTELRDVIREILDGFLQHPLPGEQLSLSLSRAHAAIGAAMKSGSAPFPATLIKAFERLESAGKTLGDIPSLEAIVPVRSDLWSRPGPGGAPDGPSSSSSAADRYRMLAERMSESLVPAIRAAEEAAANPLSSEQKNMNELQAATAKRYLRAFSVYCARQAERSPARPENAPPSKREAKSALLLRLQSEVRAAGIRHPNRTVLSLLQWFWSKEFPVGNDSDLQNLKQRAYRARASHGADSVT